VVSFTLLTRCEWGKDEYSLAVEIIGEAAKCPLMTCVP